MLLSTLYLRWFISSMKFQRERGTLKGDALKVYCRGVARKRSNHIIKEQSRYLKGYLRYKTITSQNVSSEAQIKNFFIS